MSSEAKKWWAGIAAAVVGAVLIAITVPIVTKRASTADIQVVAFSQSAEVPYGTAPTVTITVENTGSATAVDCLIYWYPGVKNLIGNPERVSYGQFAVDAGKQVQATLTSSVSYEFNGTTVSQGTVYCNNTSDLSGQSEQVTVGLP